MANSRQSKPKILPRSFYTRDTVAVARDLLGKMIVFGAVSGRVSEVEAYLGSKDPASHKKPIMSGPPGIAYVFLAYGMHWCFNAITERAGKTGGVLFCGVGDIFGPGRVSKYFGITGEHNGLDLTIGPITIVDDGFKVAKIITGPRVGITKGVNLPLRFSFLQE